MLTIILDVLRGIICIFNHINIISVGFYRSHFHFCTLWTPLTVFTWEQQYVVIPAQDTSRFSTGFSNVASMFNNFIH
jgi:hypothetical protein